MMKYALIVLIAGNMVGLEDWWLFDTDRDCLKAANLATNTMHGGDVIATCYKWENGKRGDFVASYGMSCIKGHAWNIAEQKCVVTR